MHTLPLLSARLRSCPDLGLDDPEAGTFEVGIQHNTSGEYRVLGQYTYLNDLGADFPISITGVDKALAEVKNPRNWKALFYFVTPDGKRTEIPDPRVYIEDVI